MIFLVVLLLVPYIFFNIYAGLHPSIIGGFSGMCAVMGVAATFVSSTLVEQFGILKVCSISLNVFILLLHMGKFEHSFLLRFFSLCTRLGQLDWYFKLYF